MMRRKNKYLNPVIIIGAGGHSCTLVDYLIANGRKIIGFSDNIKKEFTYKNIKIIGSDEDVLTYDNNSVELVMGLGIIPKTHTRHKLIKWFQDQGYNFITIISPNASVSSSAILGLGAQIASGSIIQSNVRIGEHSIINTNSSIDHNTKIGVNCHVAPGTTVCGDVVLEENVFVGAGSIIIEGIKVGKNTFIPAGSIIVKNIKNNISKYD